MDASTLGRFVLRRPPAALIPATGAIAYAAMSTTPLFIPSVLLHSGILVGAHDALQLPGTSSLTRFCFQWLAISVGGTLARLGPSLSALSTPVGSVALSFLLVSLQAAVAVGVAQFSLRMMSRSILPSWQQLLIYPSAWSTVGMIVSLSPVGRLLAVTPADGYSAYAWTLPFIGISAIDWLVAAWAVVLSQSLFASHLPDVPYADDSEDDEPATPTTGRKHVPTLVALLVALAMPSFFHGPVFGHDSADNVTLLPVACILPPPSKATSLTRYLEESKKYISTSKLLVWPEAAVTVTSAEEKDELFKQVRNLLDNAHQTWVAVSYLERIDETEKYWNSVTIINYDETVILPTWSKQHLVPLVESYSQVSSSDLPSVVDLPLQVPRGRHKDIHNIPISASICLDFASPLEFMQRRKPALVLGPASTWHPDIGAAMTAQARARASEVGTHIVWCDGGLGGQSGILSPHEDELIQHRADGSWVKTIRLAHPYEEPRTPYAFFGNFISLAVLLLLLPSANGPAYLLRRTARGRAWLAGKVTAAKARVQHHREERPSEQTPLLIDL